MFPNLCFRGFTGDGAIQAALGSGEWYVDTNQSTEQQSLARRTSSSSNGGGGGGDAGASGTGPGGPRLIPVKSFRNDLVDLSVRLL
jgi:hypothetical protein